MAKNLKQSYNKLVYDYINQFENLTGLKYDAKLSDDTYQFGDYYTNIADIMYIVDNGLGFDFFDKYVQHYLEESSKALTMRQFHERGLHLIEKDEDVYVRVNVTVVLNRRVGKLAYLKSNRLPQDVHERVWRGLEAFKELGSVNHSLEVIV